MLDRSGATPSGYLQPHCSQSDDRSVGPTATTAALGQVGPNSSHTLQGTRDPVVHIHAARTAHTRLNVYRAGHVVQCSLVCRLWSKSCIHVGCEPMSFASNDQWKRSTGITMAARTALCGHFAVLMAAEWSGDGSLPSTNLRLQKTPFPTGAVALDLSPPPLAQDLGENDSFFAS